jgi:ppGpp synthetase/RelA/SpoT-type nucleotidyltranferase
MIPGLQLIEKSICGKITSVLDNSGLHYRIFSRIKDSKSIEEKINRKINEGEPYTIGKKLIQDVIGIRIVTYFKDDVDLVNLLLSNCFSTKGQMIDMPETTDFKPKRTNIICEFNENESNQFFDVQKVQQSFFNLIDTTFELQLRTILSEGWHEIDHSLRYKCKSDWNGHYESERLLNGIYASLESNDIALKNLFNELSYKHFKKCNWEGMIRNKFRLNFQIVSLKNELKDLFDSNKMLAKEIYKLDREEVIVEISKCEFQYPVNLNNLVYLINKIFLKNVDLYNLTPEIMLD